MFMFWPEDYDWSWHLLRPISTAVSGGAEFNECYRTAERIRLRDPESWHIEWLRTAKHVKALAERAEAAGHPITARDHYLRAAVYFRWAEALLNANPLDPRRVPTYDEGVACFQRGGRSFVPALEHVEIPYEGSSLPGYFYPGRGAAGRRVATVVYIAGADVLKEELYFMGGKALVDRGFALLTMDGPGQGASLRHRNLYTRHDYEVPVRAALDFLESRSEVDRDRLALFGRSFGGYYAARAAAFEPRVKALVVFGGPYEVPKDQPRHPRWQWLINAKDAEEAEARYKKFTLEGIVGQIRCPMLIVHGERDHLTPVAHARRLYAEATVPKNLVVYPVGALGDGHCQYDSFPETLPLMADWLCDQLGHSQV